jgi:hypothetical protein
MTPFPKSDGRCLLRREMSQLTHSRHSGRQKTIIVGMVVRGAAGAAAMADRVISSQYELGPGDLYRGRFL